MRIKNFTLTSQGNNPLEVWLRKELDRLNKEIRQDSDFTLYSEKDNEINLSSRYTKILIEDTEDVTLSLKVPEDKRIHLVSVVGVNFKILFSKVSPPATILYSTDITSASRRIHTFIIEKNNTVIKL